MDRSIEIYIIDGISHEKHIKTLSEDGRHDSTTPNFVPNLNIFDYGLMVANLMRFGDVINRSDINVHFVDERLKRDQFYTDEGKLFFEELLKLVQNPFVHFHDCNWVDFSSNLVLDSMKNYFFITPLTFMTDYHFFNYLGINLSSNYYIYHGAKSLLDCKNARCPINIFDNVNPNTALDTYGRSLYVNQTHIMYILDSAVKQTRYLINAGFLTRQRFVQVAVPAWCLNVRSPFIHGVILQNNILPEYKVMFSEKLCTGKTTQEKFNESSEYRYTITDLMCKTLAEFAINFNKVSFVENNHTFNFEQLLV
jgi:hypothetical protein